jgi:type VI secretion system Hcp family effector
MSAAAVLYLKLTAPGGEAIAGEVRVAAFKDQIEIGDWRWQLRHKDNTTRAEPTVLQFGKIMDRATTAMLLHMRKGTRLAAEITVHDSAEDNAFKLILRLKDVRITDYGFDIKASEDQAEGHVEEEWTFDYATIEFEFASQQDKGSAKVQLQRPAGASMEAPGGLKEKMLKMAGGLSVGQLDELWEALKRDADQRRMQGDKQKQPSEQ